jgi:serine/threonine-protein kinase
VIGARLGPYEITGAIGAGGMGEVYRGRDAALNRDVAIKVLPAAMASDADGLARFKREAQVLASLNHPNIAHVYGFEGAALPDGSTAHFLAMELVEGEDLAERLRRGAIPVDEAIAIAKQIAEGLEEAHERGIIHRDLKPANVKVTPDGKVKILDFGLAKALERDPSNSTGNSQLSHSPTMSRHMTEAGMIMGTAAYMSPEQARGKVVDKRTDIWAFGVVFFEMLTGRRLFSGETVSDVLAAVLTREPDWASLPAATPAGVRDVLRRCLERDPRRRLRDIGDARLGLDAAPDAPARPVTPSGRGSGLKTAAVALAFVLMALAGGFAVGRAAKLPAVGVARFEIALPPGLAVRETNWSTIAIAHDNRAIVFVGEDGTKSRLYIRWLDRTEVQPIPGTEEGSSPFFSPDDRSVGFFTGSELRRASLYSDTVTTVTTTRDNNGAVWAPDGTIIFAAGYSSGLLRVDAAGGEPLPLTRKDASAQEAGHSWPEILPDGEHVLYTVEYTGKPFDEAAIAVVSLKTGKSRIIQRGGSWGRYSPSGHLLFMRGSRVLAAPFDLRRLEVTGEVTTVLDGVAAEVSRGSAMFAMSPLGALVFVPGDSNEYARELSWATRDGSLTPASAQRRGFFWGDIAPDGSKVLYELTGSDDELWLLDLTRDIPKRVTFGTENTSPAWAPDGKRFVWASDRSGPFNLFMSSIDHPSVIERLTTGPVDQLAGNWTPDGGQVVYSQDDSETRGDIWAVDTDTGRQTREIVRTRFDERSPALSPDGRLLAYTSDESGTWQVYVQAFPGPGPKRQVSDRSPGAATFGNADGILRWSPDGRELFYLDAGRLMAASIRFDRGLDSGAPRLLFERPDFRSFNVSPDGKRFLIVRNIRREPLRRIVIALGASSEIGRPERKP